MCLCLRIKGPSKNSDVEFYIYIKKMNIKLLLFFIIPMQLYASVLTYFMVLMIKFAIKPL